MKRRAFWIALVAGAAVVGVVLALVVLAQPGSAGAQAPQQADVPDALFNAFVAAGVPVETVTTYTSGDFPEAYTAICRSLPGSNPVNFGLAYQQASTLANQGLPIRSLHLLCVDSSGASVFENTVRVDQNQTAPGPKVDEQPLSALRSSLSNAVAETVLASAAAGIQPADVSVSQNISGILADVELAASDVAAAKSAATNGLVQEVVESCRSAGAAPGARTVRVRIVAPDEKVVVNYLKDLDSGDLFVYWDPQIGSGWIDMYGPFQQ